jgi:hypothetical protein
MIDCCKFLTVHASGVWRMSQRDQANEMKYNKKEKLDYIYIQIQRRVMAEWEAQFV